MSEIGVAFVFLIYTLLPAPSLSQSITFADLTLCESAARGARHYWASSPVVIPTMNIDGGACVPVPACPR